MSKHRHHHYVAAFHLARFTRNGSQDGKLAVFDLRNQRSWNSTPRDTGKAKDFYRLDDETDPLAIENGFLQTIENAAACAFEEILRVARGSLNAGMTRARVHHEQLYALIRFVAVQAIRGPDQRSDINNICTEVAAAFLQHRHRVAAEFRSEIERLVGDPNFAASTDRSSQVRTSLSNVPRILEGLLERRWKILLTPPRSPPLICSDKPVVVLPGPSHPVGMPFGFATPGTGVLIPLALDAVLYGHRMTAPSDEYIDVEHLPKHETPILNAIIAGSTHQYVYCASEEELQLVVDVEGRIGGARELFADAALTMQEREKHARKRAAQRLERLAPKTQQS